MENIIYKPYQVQIKYHVFREGKVYNYPEWEKYKNYLKHQYAEDAIRDLRRGYGYRRVGTASIITRFRIINL